MKYLKYFESIEEKETKVLILVFLIHRDSVSEHDTERVEKFYEYQKIFRNLEIDWWVKPQTAHHRGVAYQSILNTDDLDIARRTAEYIQSEFDEPILICLSRENISRHEPVGESNDKGWWKIGRAFDKMVLEDKKGIHII
jgi:hypothetical protein